ncbi:hypothetical protein AAIB78_001667 [Morganella morganii]
MIKALFLFLITIFTANYALADEVLPDINSRDSWASSLKEGPIKHFSYDILGRVCVTGKGVVDEKSYTACTTARDALLFVFTSYTQNIKVNVTIGQKGNGPVYIHSMTTID